MRRIALLIVSSLPLTACAADLEVEAIVGTWELQDVSGETCAVQPGGELEIFPDYEGTFEWTIDCMDAGVLTEVSTVENFSIERSNVEYSFDIRTETETFDWECVIDGGEMDCTETVGAQIRIFKFQRETN